MISVGYHMNYAEQNHLIQMKKKGNTKHIIPWLLPKKSKKHRKKNHELTIGTIPKNSENSEKFREYE